MQTTKTNVIKMVESLTELASRCIGPFIITEREGGILRLTTLDLEKGEALRSRLERLIGEKMELEDKIALEESSVGGTGRSGNGSSGLPSTMQWSAKIHTISPGRDIRIPVPTLPEPATLQWCATRSLPQ